MLGLLLLLPMDLVRFAAYGEDHGRATSKVASSWKQQRPYPAYMEHRAFRSFPLERLNPTGIFLPCTAFSGAVYDAFRLETETDWDDFSCDKLLRLPGSDVIEGLTASKIKVGELRPTSGIFFPKF